MLQAIVKKGKVFAEKVSAPVVSKNMVLIKVVNSCISAGTEISGVKDSGTSLIKKVLDKPEQLAKVVDMVRQQGFWDTYEKIKGKLEIGVPTGYSISGVVMGVGEGVSGFKTGDEVAAAGAGLANHAEYVNIPENLVMKMPKGMNFKEASTVTLGGIAMQGVRRVDLRLGEYAVVVGAGILGLLSIQMLKLAGVRVAVIDLDEKRLEIAKELGAEIILDPVKTDTVKEIENWANGYGADAVLFTAATSSNEPLSQAFQMCRKKGKVVLVGVSGMEIKREDIYAKELDFQVSTSYGPGRYDKNYEEKGLDYPYAYVRWTENRNMREYLRLVRDGHIKLDKMINAVYPIEKVTEAFESLQDKANKPLMVILDYGQVDKEKINSYLKQDRKIFVNNIPLKKDIINVALVGAGGFATGMHLPNIRKLKDKYRLYCVMNRTGHKAKAVAEQYKANYATTNYEDVLKDKNVDLVLIATRHDSHADLTIKALKAGKHVFVEKPLATTQEELERIIAFYDSNEFKCKPVLLTGFNRRFSKYAQEIKKYTDKRINPLFISYRMNAGFIPLDHWVHEDGGRIVGEGCHIIDLMSFFTGSKIVSISCEEITPVNEAISFSDNKAIILKYEDGSVANINYFAIGSKEYPKEYMEVHFDQKTIVLDDYKALKGYGVKIKEITTAQSEKGQFEELERLYEILRGDKQDWPIELWDMEQTTRVGTFK
ncbi:Gfo/Idh/MocA family oxidoreductase [bacterium]|jgi:predicted dehydrogenase/threonine dehydrogenase-like Zn-dependent dehydrogenase|nr:Gfo/Idh/MocA family oxidoreductase [bacterium]MBT3581954.1 Gfo/Idh/MocA family oxidoreductase [bacterium]MBT4551693.1 Gfo/Idh/MocA family oxidoreductase [bacterium]MBT7088508.1 Gfo/Idh/MocA family oxidoreductase [bacterium]